MISIPCKISGLLGKTLKLGFVALTASSSLLGQAGSSYKSPDFSNLEPIQLEIVQESGPLGARFVHPTSEGVEIEMVDGHGMIIVGWDHMEQFQINKPMTESLNIALAQQDPKLKAEQLKAEVVPLFPLASIKPGSTNIHLLIDAYLKAIIEAERWEEGYEASQITALNRSPASTVLYFYSIAENLFVTGRQEKGLKLLDQLVASRPLEESREQTLKVANRLADSRLFEPAFRLFKPIAAQTKGLDGKLAILRAAYLCLELGDDQGAGDYLFRAKEIPEESVESEGSYYLVVGVRAFLNGDASLALNHLGHAMSLVEADSSLKLVGLYFTFLAYENQEQADISVNILDEMKLLFPDASYTNALDKETSTTSQSEN
ncbi:MAG: hypothetical protein ACSHX4_07780 [Opitutaceae bacterium]